MTRLCKRVWTKLIKQLSKNNNVIELRNRSNRLKSKVKGPKTTLPKRKRRLKLTRLRRSFKKRLGNCKNKTTKENYKKLFKKDLTKFLKKVMKQKKPLKKPPLRENLVTKK